MQIQKTNKQTNNITSFGSKQVIFDQIGGATRKEIIKALPVLKTVGDNETILTITRNHLHDKTVVEAAKETNNTETYFKTPQTWTGKLKAIIFGKEKETRNLFALGYGDGPLLAQSDEIIKCAETANADLERGLAKINSQKPLHHDYTK